jgi:hypothetical protein
VVPRDRLRLVLVLGLLGAWLLRWTSTRDAFAAGPDRTGAVAALALIALWGLALTLGLAREAPALRRGAALTDAALAAALGLLLAFGHPWLAGADLRDVLAPVFGPLALLALLDAGLGGRDGVVVWLRGLAALVAAVLVAKKGAAWPAGVLAWLALSPVLLRGAPVRRRVEALLLIATAAAFFAPVLHRLTRGGEPASGIYEGRFVWQALCVALALLTVPAVLGRRRAPGGIEP